MKRLFVDMDGTLAKFNNVDTLETLYEKNYFLNLEPMKNVVEAIKKIVLEHPEIDVYILSSVLSDSQYALVEKNQWLDRYIPEISKEKRIFPPCGKDKKEFIFGGVSTEDFLLDDYSVNLNAWEPPAKGIKIMNGINGTKGTWSSEKISAEKSGAEIAYNLVNIITGKKHYYDFGPIGDKDEWKLADVYLTHDGYARFDLIVSDSALGYWSESTVSGLYCIEDRERGCFSKLIKIDTYGIVHPVLNDNFKEIEREVAKKIKEIQKKK